MVNLEALANFTYLFDRIGQFGGIAGVNMSKPNYRPTLITWIWVVFNSLSILFVLFTMVTYEPEIKWKSATVLGIAVQVKIILWW